MIDEEVQKELATLRQAVRDLYALQRRFKPASFERDPMPALQRILANDDVPEDRPA